MSRLKGTTLYELFLTHQQRALRWEQSGTRSWRDILASFAVSQLSSNFACIGALKKYFQGWAGLSGTLLVLLEVRIGTIRRGKLSYKSLRGLEAIA